MAPSVMDRAAQMFPKLTPAQIERISAIGHRRDVRAGEVLFEVGRAEHPLLRGAVGRDRGRAPGRRSRGAGHRAPARASSPARSTCSRPGAASCAARIASDGAVIAVDRDDLRALVQRDSELSEILMRAFILRRVALMAAGQPTTWSCSARATRRSTLRIREFLSRNGQPFTYQDVETDPGVQALLDRFHVGVNDVPVIVCQRRPRAQEPVHRRAGRRRSASAPSSIRRRCATS